MERKASKEKIKFSLPKYAIVSDQQPKPTASQELDWQALLERQPGHSILLIFGACVYVRDVHTCASVYTTQERADRGCQGGRGGKDRENGRVDGDIMIKQNTKPSP